MATPSIETSGLNGTATAELNSSGHESFKGRFRRLEIAMKDCLQVSKQMNMFEKTLDEMRRLKQELAAYEAGEQRMLEAFTRKYDKWKTEKEVLENDLKQAKAKNASIEDEAKAARGNARLVETLTRKNEKLERIEHEYTEQKTYLKGVQQVLKEYREDLRQRDNEVGLQPLKPNFPTQLNDLATELHELAEKYFFTTLSDQLSDHDDLFIGLQRSPLWSIISKPIPISNTAQSRHLRMAAAEEVIAREISEDIFQPLYILELRERKELVNVLDRLSENSPRRESILQSLLFTAYEADLQVRVQKVVALITASTLDTGLRLLISPGKGEGFKSALETLLFHAAELWAQTQRSPERIVATMEDADWGWGFYTEHEQAVQLSPEQRALVPAPPRPAKIIFPRVYVPNNSNTLHAGIALWSDYGIVIAGDIEAREQGARVNTKGGKMNAGSGRRKAGVSAPSAGSLRSSHQRRASSPGSTTSSTTLNRSSQSRIS